MVRLPSVLLLAALAAAVATLAWRVTDRPPFDAAVERAAAEAALSADPGRCPLSSGATARAATWVLRACADGGIAWLDAAERYGPVAETVWREHGDDPVFRRVFARLGHPVIPVVALAAETGSFRHVAAATLADTVSRAWSEGTLSLEVATLSPDDFGRLAIRDLDTRGHAMLAEYEIVGGVARYRPVTSALNGTRDLLFGGVTDLEAVIVRGERAPTPSEVGLAALDGVLVAGGIGAAAKVVQGVRTSAGTVATMRAAGGGAVRALATVGRAAGVAGVVAVPVLALTRPGLLADAAGWVAEAAGLPGWTGVFALFLVAFAVVGVVARVVFGPVLAATGMIGRVAARMARRPAGVRAAASP
jgi:hypothetical protein